jgi:serine/threonine-protein kinase
VALNIGDVVDGKYRIVRLLGEGGMGAVYEGENTRIHRRVAIKVLHSTVAQDQAAVQRFEREAQAAGRIGNQHIVEVLDLGNLPDGDRYMVMEFLDGESLAERIKTRGRLQAAEVCNMALGMLEGLAAAHDVGIIHRDLKPDNVFLVRRGGQADFVKLVDFGISKFNVVGGEFSMTRTGAVMGTPYYMSPEQAKGTRDIDHRVDLYAAGVILYEAVSGQVPFDAETFNELLFKIVLEDAPPISKIVPELDAGFAQIVDKARSKDPAQRYQNAREFQQALQGWASGAKVDFSSFGATQAHGVTPVHGSPTLGQGTSSAWAQSAERSVPTRSKAWLWVAIAAAVLLVGGIFMALKSSSESEGVAKEAQAARAEQTRLAEEAVKGKEVAEKARQDAERAAEAAGEKMKQAEAAAAQAQQQAQGAASAPAVRPLPPGSPTTAVKPKAAAPVAKPAAPAPAPKPSTNTGTSGSRKIRTSL